MLKFSLLQSLDQGSFSMVALTSSQFYCSGLNREDIYRWTTISQGSFKVNSVAVVLK